MGTYGSFAQAFRGYAASQDCSVGYWSDHEAEAKAFERRRKEAKKTLAGLQPFFQRLYDRFADGSHPWRRHVANLDRDRTRSRDDDYKLRFDLPSFKDSEVSGGRLSLHLFVKRDLPPAIRELTLAGFLLSQAAHFRERFRIDPVGTPFEDLFSGWGWTEVCLSFPQALMRAFADEDALRRDPSTNAALLRSVLDATPIPDEVVATADPGLLVRFCPDAQWPQVQARVRVALGDLEGRDSVVREWWAPLL